MPHIEVDSTTVDALLRVPPHHFHVHAKDAVVEIEPPSGWPRVELRELWAYRELFLFLVWRDIKVRYAQTVLGAGWVVLQPIATTLVFTIVFGRLARIPSDGVPYSVFALAALIPWNYFSGALTGASTSLISNTNLITKVYFPRLVIPFAPILSGLVNFAITFGALLLVLALLGRAPRPSAAAVVPLVVLVMMLAAAGVGCWLSALALQVPGHRRRDGVRRADLDVRVSGRRLGHSFEQRQHFADVRDLASHRRSR